MTSVIGKTEEQAKSELEGIGFKVNVGYEENTSKDNGTVLKQSLDTGKVADEGTTVTLTVNKLAELKTAIISIAFFIITWVLPDFNTNLTGLSFVNMLYKYTQGEIDIADTVTFVTSAITSIRLTITLMQRRKSVK